MDPDRPPTRVAALLARFDTLGLPARTRVLVCGADAAALGAALRARGFEPISAADPMRLDMAPGSVGAAIASGFLERLEWDRWALQEIHRALGDGAPLVLEAENLMRLGSPADLAFLAGRVAKQAGITLRRALRQPPAPPRRFRGRRYRPAALQDMLESLGFEIERAWADQRSVALDSSRGGMAAAAAPHEAGVTTWTIVARKRGALYGDPPARPWPAPAAHARRFAATHRDFLAARDSWLAAHPEWAPRSLERFASEAYRGRTVLVLAPHPDDELLGCGGTTIRLAAAGARVIVLHATDGSEAASLLHAPDDVRRTVRVQEARDVADALGLEAVFWGESNAAFRERPELVTKLAALLRERQPSLVFTPFVTDVHPDHRVLSRLLVAALADAPGPERILAYQVWCLLPPNCVCDVTREMPAMSEAFRLYETAMKVEDYIHIAQDRNLATARERLGASGYAEAFYSIPAREAPALFST